LSPSFSDAQLYILLTVILVPGLGWAVEINVVPAFLGAYSPPENTDIKQMVVK
jgi:hypothetical protein